jgi:glutamate-1-semialdehyde 2,1-aminomutase
MLFTKEAALYTKRHPKTAARLKTDDHHFFDGVPFHWMKDWSMPFPLLIDQAQGSIIQDIDGHILQDFCLGDTGSFFGHSPAPVACAISRQSARGLTYMLPTEDALDAATKLSSIFGTYKWQICTTATDANRNAIRVARAITGRSKILVFNGCYHGTVEDVMVEQIDGTTRARQGLVGQLHDLTKSAVAVEFNDLVAVENALKSGDIAAILTEPVMTNSCMVLPLDGFHTGLRDLATRYGALLIIDETHTISSGYGGYTRIHGLDPDIFVVGKAIAGGMPTAVWGMRDMIADRFMAYDAVRPAGHSGMGTTLSANPMQFACLKATLDHVMTQHAYDHMERGARILAQNLSEIIEKHGAPWHVVRVGARVEFICAPNALINGTEAAAAHAPELEKTIHLALVNRGCLIAPFHNMMLVSPATTDEQIGALTSAFDAITAELFAK